MRGSIAAVLNSFWNPHPSRKEKSFLHPLHHLMYCFLYYQRSSHPKKSLLAPPEGASTPIENCCSKDSDFGLVSNKNLVKIPLAIEAQGVIISAKCLNLSHLMTSPTKKRNPKLFNFCLIWSRRLAASFRGLNNSLAQSPGEFRWCKKMLKKRLMWV